MTKTTYKLQYPFTHNGAEITEISLRRPKTRDVKKAGKLSDNMDRSSLMLVDLAEVEPEVIEELDFVDFQAASKIVSDFMGLSEA